MRLRRIKPINFSQRDLLKSSTAKITFDIVIARDYELRGWTHFAPIQQCCLRQKLYDFIYSYMAATFKRKSIENEFIKKSLIFYEFAKPLLIFF